MGRGTSLGLLAATALLVVGAVLLLQDDAPQLERGAPPVVGAGEDTRTGSLPAEQPSEARLLEPAPADGVAPAPAAATEATDAELALARLTGRVTRRDDGTPVAGVAIEARFLDLGDKLLAATDLPGSTTRDVTDADGRYDLAASVPCRLFRLDVGPGPDTARQREEQELELALGTETTLDVGVGPGGQLAGTVVDPSGATVPAATVRGWTAHRHELDGTSLPDPDRIVQADASGAFAIGGLGPEFLLAAEGEGLVAHDRIHGTVAHGASLQGLELIVSSARRLDGRVLETGERPVAGAPVSVSVQPQGADETLTGVDDVYRTGPPTLRLRSDAQGRFAAEGLPSRTAQVKVDTGRHPEWIGEHAPGQGELLVRLEAGTSLTGLVLDSGGATVALAQVRLGGGDVFAEGGNDRTAITDASGRFVLNGLKPDERATLAVLAEGHAVHVEQPVVITAAGPNEVTLRLGPARAIAGRVVDRDGAPVAGAHVSIEGDRIVDPGEGVTMSPAPTWERQFPGLAYSSSDAAGAFRFGQLYEGTFEVVAKSDELGATARARVSSGSEDLLLVLDPHAIEGVTFVGAAVDATTGLPVSSFFVTPMLPSGQGGLSGSSHVFDDSDGRYRITGLEPGEIQLDASAQGFAPWSRPLQRYEEGEHRVDIALLPQRSVRLLVVDPEGQPLDVALTFRDSEGRALMVEDSANSRTSRIETGDDGEVLAAGLPAALVTVSAEKGWFGKARDYTLDLRYPPRDVVRLVYGETDVRALLVVVVTGEPGAAPAAAGTTPESLAAMLSALVADLQAGHLRPLDAPATLVLRDGSGPGAEVLAQGNLDPAAAPDADSFRVPGVEGSFAVRLDVPARPGVLSVSAAGYRSQAVTWQPSDDESGLDVTVVVLQRD